MAARGLDPKKVAQIKSMRAQGKTNVEIASKLGIHRQTVAKYGGKASDPKEARLPTEINVPIDNRDDESGDTIIVTPDRPRTLEEMAQLFGIDQKEWVAESIRSNEWQGFYRLRSGMRGHHEKGYRKVALWQTRVTWKRVISKPLEEGIKAFAKKYGTAVAPRMVSKPAKFRKRPYVVCWGLWDAHLGMYAWAPEVGGESFDLNIATNRVMNSIDDMCYELEPYGIERIWMPIGNDFMHFDSVRHKTAFGDHYLDTDTRFAKVYEACLRCLAYMVERAVQISNKVELLYVPGNHDRTASYTLCMCLQQRYRNWPEVTVDVEPNPRKYRRHGGTLIGFDHGETPPAQLAQIFPTECREHWSMSTYREFQVGHTHQRREREYNNLTPTNGVLVRTNPSLCSVDDWHHRQGLIGEPMKSVEAYRYDETGFRGSHVVWARDHHHPQSNKPLIGC